MNKNSNRPSRPNNFFIRWVMVSFVVLIILGVNATLAYRWIDDISTRHQSVTNTGNVIVRLKEIHQAVLAAESGQRGYLLTEDERYLGNYEETLALLDLRIEAVGNIRTEIPGQAERIRNLLQLVDEKITELKKTVDLALINREADALRMVMTGRGRDLYREIVDAFEEIESAEFTLQAVLFSDLMLAERNSRINFTIGLFLSVALIGALLFLVWISFRKERSYQEKLENINQELEQKVEDRTQEIQLYSEELARSNRELEDFAFVASHDLQEPLRKIQTFSSRIESLYGDIIDDRGQDYLSRMKNAATRMSALISDLLEFSRIKSRGKPFEKVDINETISEVLEDIEVAIEETGAKINTKNLPAIYCDVTQIRQVFHNLFTNAIKFQSKNESPVITVEHKKLTLKDDLTGEPGEWHRFIVADNGIGFSEDFSDKIFVPFQRLHGRDQYKGTGIGLAICRRIVERHGGEITASSVEGEGSIFTILLPEKPVDINVSIS